MTYLVSVPTTCTMVFEVEAEDETSAKNQVLEGNSELINTDYDEILDSNTFTVTEK